MKQNEYYTNPNGFADPNDKFVSYSFRTKKTIVHCADGTNHPSFHSYNTIKALCENGEWTKLNHKTAFAMIKPLNKTEILHYYIPTTKDRNNDISLISCNKVTKKTTIYYKNGKLEERSNYAKCGKLKPVTKEEALHIIKNIPKWKFELNFEAPKNEPKERYFTKINGFVGDIVFIKYDPKEPNSCKSYSVNGEFVYSFSLPNCENWVKEGKWKEITKEEAEAMLTMDISSEQNIIYYNHVNDFVPKEQFFSYNPNTKECKIHNIKNKDGKIATNCYSIATNCYSYDMCEQFVKEKNWKHITKDEAYALLKTGEIIYYTTNNPQGFMDDTKFLSHDVDTGVTKVHTLNNKEGIINNSHTFKKLENTVKFGYLHHITKEEAETMFQKEDEIEYYKHKETFNDGTIFLEWNKTEKNLYSCNKQIKIKCNHHIININYFVETGALIKITKDEAYALIYSPEKKDIVYYNHVNGFSPKEQFLSYDPNTEITKVHNLNHKDGYDVSTIYAFRGCEAFVKDGEWKHITKDEDYALLKEPVKDDGFLYFSGCYVSNNIKYIIYDVNKRNSYYVEKDGNTFNAPFTLTYLEDKVKYEGWKQLTRNEAFALLETEIKPVQKDESFAMLKLIEKIKDEEENGNILEDIYAIRCFFNGKRKMTDQLTQEEAYTFRKAAGNLYSYLTKEYKLSKPKKK